MKNSELGIGSQFQKVTTLDYILLNGNNIAMVLIIIKIKYI